MITQVEIARILKLDVSTVNKILNRKRGTKFRPETVEKVYKLARKNGFDFSRLKHSHRRKHERQDVDFSAKLTVRNPDGSLFDRGESRVRDLSVGGARLSEIDLKKGSLPVENFRFQVEVGNVKVDAVPVRFISNGRLGLAVQFIDVDSATRKKITRMI